MQAKPRVFISYAREDAAFASALSHALSERGIEAWVDREEIQAGDDWVVRIEQAMAKSDLILLLLSSEYRSESFANYERALAIKLAREPIGVRVVPVLVPGASWNALPPSLRSYQALKADESIEEVAERVADLAERSS